MFMENEEKLEEIFKILSNANRLKIIRILSRSKNREATVNEIAEQTHITQPAASQHLKLLKTTHILKAEKKGNNIYYRINKNTMIQYKECIDNLFQLILE